MQEFEFLSTKSLKEALKFMDENGKKTKVIAGGTDLMIDLRQYKFDNLEYILDISSLSQLQYINKTDNKIRVGGLTRHKDVTESKLIQNKASLLAEGCSQVGSPQIRNRGTLAGNIATASPCADSVSPLVALDAVVVLKSRDDKREIPLSKLIEGPYNTGIKDNELITEIYFTIPEDGVKSKFIKLARRNAAAKSRLNIACLAEQDNNGTINYLSLVPGSVTPCPQRFSEVEEMLLDEIPDEKLLKKAGDMVAKEMIKQTGYRWSTDYKKPAVTSLTSRVLHSVLEVK